MDWPRKVLEPSDEPGGAMRPPGKGLPRVFAEVR